MTQKLGELTEIPSGDALVAQLTGKSKKSTISGRKDENANRVDFRAAIPAKTSSGMMR